MKTTLTLLAVGTALVLPVGASAQSAADIAYCKKLAMLWYTYFDTTPRPRSPRRSTRATALRPPAFPCWKRP